MWIFTETGAFYSAVQSYDDPDKLVVRSRDRESSQALAEWLGEGAEVLETPRRDYRFRVICTREQWADFLYMWAHDVKAKNFKDEVKKNLGKTSRGPSWLSALNAVWWAGFDYQNTRYK